MMARALPTRARMLGLPVALPALSAAMALLLAPAAAAEPLAALGGYDIGELLGAARSHYDMALMDAVVLLDERGIAIEGDGTLSTTVHTIVWFSTEIGLDTYADIRVPYDTATSTLEVLALRTWRDGTWWPDESGLSPTAIVETTPYAIQSAYDYTTMRETVLLHDGVELPCIVETAYRITETGGADPGVDGLWMIRGRDPAVRRRLSVAAPTGVTLRFALMNGAPEPVRSDTPGGGSAYAWSAAFVDRLPRPLTSDSRADNPYVVWSVWQSWDSLGNALSTAIDEAATLNEALRESVAIALGGLPFPYPRAEAVAAFVRETTRPVRYDDSFWRFDPRPAVRTWETAYGHALDRTVLAAALFREAGLGVEPTYTTAGRAPVDVSVPALAWFDNLGLRLGADGLAASFNPVSGQLSHGAAGDAGRTVWFVGSGANPSVIGDGGQAVSTYDLVLTLEPEEGDDGGWTGSGLLATTGSLSAYGRAVGTEGEVGGFLSRVAGSVVDGASADAPGVAELTRDRTAAGFAIELAAREQDAEGRTAFVVGDPEGGVVASLPGDVHLYCERRDSPVLLPGPLRESVTLRLYLGEMEEVRIPQQASVSNRVGSFEVEVEHGGDGIVTVRRSLSIGTEGRAGGGGAAGEPAGYRGVMIPAADWPLLRQLLLEETDPRHRTLLLR